MQLQNISNRFQASNARGTGQQADEKHLYYNIGKMTAFFVNRSPGAANSK